MTLCPRLAQPCHVGSPGLLRLLFFPAGKKTPLKFFQATVTKPQHSDRHFPGPEQPPVLPSSRHVALRDPDTCLAAVVWGNTNASPACFRPSLDPRKRGIGGIRGVFMASGLFTADCLWQWVPQTAPYRRCFGQDKDIPVIPGKGLSRPSHGGLILTASPPG